MKNKVTKRRVLFRVLVSLTFFSCGNMAHPPEFRGANEKLAPKGDTVAGPISKKAKKGKRPSEVISDKEQTKLQKLYDFAQNLEQGHLRSSGLLIDFGTPARHKYTFGDWKSGWRGDFEQEGTSFSYMASRTAHMFFDVFPSEAGKGRITFRLLGHGSKDAGIYLNGKYQGEIEFSDSEFGHASIEISNGFVKGENHIQIRCRRRSKVQDGGKAALALDYVRIISDMGLSRPAASSYQAVRFPDSTGRPDGIVLQDGESLTFHLPVPNGAKLRGEARARTAGEKSQLKVIVSLNSQEQKIISDRQISDQTTHLNLPMDAFQGRVVGITLRALNGEVVIRDAGLFMPKGATKELSGSLRARNFILVLIDTLRADRLALYNKQTRVQTAYLDSLGQESMIFERALAPENWTKPSVASMLSGLYPGSHRTQNDRAKLPKTVVLASEHFKKLGFTTAGFVANGYVSNKFGFKRGWDTWTNYVREHKANRARFVVDDALAWLNAKKDDKPFFLYIHTIDPHVPYISPKKYWSRYDSGTYNGPIQPTKTAKLLEQIKTGRLKLSQRDKIRLEALYDGEITYHDDHLSRLHDAMKQKGLLDDTLIIVTSDHGEEFFEHGLVGHGHSLFEELLHVPLIIRLPQSEGRKPTRSNKEVSLVDVFPTACEMLGVECPKGIEGLSLVPLLKGEPWPHFPSVSFSTFLGSQRAVRMGRYKAVFKGLRMALYDLEKDPKETQNLKEALPFTRAGLRDVLGRQLGRFIVSDVNRAESKPKRHKEEKTTIDPETRRQLKALGYLGGE